ncbi:MULTISPECIES: ATP phosphoribosyltransferase regulatory subunit [unclassified Synechococcus]|uniref:ATP phosphoribosyltransferase regulatory subunit n=1 Tax=unclassified Synechococcus TaxID=2626047 RepID=UPI002AD36985|nr:MULTISPECIES: ATP phosphoribosyltransferase regulatory subunit [unclassified Synechococcus]MEA5424462.1 ATP phosphoribosyltransferase regulatory subunit [Synechococcus sp. CCY9202]CAK6694126.1 ATP phosphoribosyltransferase regulatory subunit [Synechococcus sp. CBW1107]
MALQPAAGARDRHPREVERNRRLVELLAGVFRLWGYQEVDPPTIERIDTLEAGGAIATSEMVRLASDDPLALRPELTASIARAASTRLAGRPRPLRLWASGNTFRSVIADGGDQRISEQVQCGVELLGEPSAAADTELLHLLLAAAATLGLQPHHQPRLLVGHHGILSALLASIPVEQAGAVRQALTSFDPLALDQLALLGGQRSQLQQLMRLRGEPTAVLYQLEQWLGPIEPLNELAQTLASVAPMAASLGVALQLDPTFQPHFALYDGLVIKLVCQAADAPRDIASGGRYDKLVGRFCSDAGQAAGVGFAFAIDAIRDLLGSAASGGDAEPRWLVSCRTSAGLPKALQRLQQLHVAEEAAELGPKSCASQAEADTIARERGCRGAIWLPD